MERKYGKFAINNLTLYIIGLYVIGYIFQLLSTVTGLNIAPFLTLNPHLILKGQIWRLVSWVLIPPQELSIWLLITLYLYYFIGTTMERTIGTFRYNVFIFGGMLFMIIGAFLSYGISYLKFGSTPEYLAVYMATVSSFFSTYYLQQTVFLSFALSYPDIQLLLFFIIPVKVSR